MFLDLHGPSCTSFALSGRPRASFLRLISCNKFHACFHCVPLHAGAGSPVTNSRPACCGAATVSVGEWPCTQALIGEWPKSSWSYSPAQASLGRESRLEACMLAEEIPGLTNLTPVVPAPGSGCWHKASFSVAHNKPFSKTCNFPKRCDREGTSCTAATTRRARLSACRGAWRRSSPANVMPRPRSAGLG